MAEIILLRDVISILKAEIVQLRDTNQKQAIKIEELERRVGMNPRNSSVPPSSEGLRKPNSPSREARRKLGKKPGKQPGDKGLNLAKVENPDQVIVHSPKSCTNCYSDLENAPVTSTDKRQVFELPDIALVVTEHVIETKTCECGSVTQADIPLEAKANTCYGPGIRALAVYLSCYQHIPYDRLGSIRIYGFEICAYLRTLAIASHSSQLIFKHRDIWRTLCTLESFNCRFAGGSYKTFKCSIRKNYSCS